MNQYHFGRGMEVVPAQELNYEFPHHPLTVPIVGIPKGGTTMVAAVVEALGVYMGPQEDLKEFNFEDQTMHQPYLDKVFPAIKQRDSEHEVWGWKDPVGITSVRQVMFALRSPRLIMVFRDMLASIQGTMNFEVEHDIDPRRTFGQLAEQTMRWWDENMDYLSLTNMPTLCVSYERAKQMPEELIRQIVDFLGIDPTDEQRADALARISPQGGYIKW